MIDGHNYSATKATQSPLSKLDDNHSHGRQTIDKAYFRAFLNTEDTQSSKVSSKSIIKQSSAQDTASVDPSLVAINFFATQTLESLPSLSIDASSAQMTPTNTAHVTPDASSAQNTSILTNATTTTASTLNAPQATSGATLPLTADANTTANAAPALAQNSASTAQALTSALASSSSGTPETSTPQTSQTPTPHISAQSLAAISKGPATPLSQSDLNLIAQSTPKQAGTVATSTATNPNSALQIQTNTAQAGVGQVNPQTAIPQGASAQFLQSAKGINGPATEKSGPFSSSPTAQSNQSTSTPSTSQINPATIAQAASVQTPSTPQAGMTQGQVLSGNDITNFGATTSDADLAELPETTLKNTNFTSSSTSTQPNPTTELPASLRNANPVTQQAWAGVIQRLDGKSQQFQIRLDPAELGRINVSIEITKDKKATVTLAAKSAEALSELSKGSKALQDALAEAGVELEEGGLKLELSPDDSSSFTFSDDDGSQTANKKDGISKDADPSTDQPSNEPYHITPELTAWSRARVDLKA